MLFTLVTLNGLSLARGVAGRAGARAWPAAHRPALARGEFEVHYQPIVDIRSERVCGYEALTRWRHRERGLLPPSEFIGIAEEVGFIIPLGEWVLRKACNDAADWSPYLRLAVNISPAQCTQALTRPCSTRSPPRG